ncbi:Cof-type HAD-IIB family hydrolase [Levilactobacillus fujinensis]|uniref:Cof-type HAD-IIB family hydrolase n=1 Tax=Levilactobacillus fujinensis TaxID=2486024 RepID=A0ABW1TKN7_9LACO|nr:HAD family hydrolase [Levilactobacillus fujinensis]
MIKHIFTDMDGTLLNSCGELSPVTRQVVRQSQIPVTLVSARAPLEMANAIKQLGLTAPQIAFNGGMIFYPGQPQALQCHFIPRDASTVILSRLKRDFPSVSVSCYDQDNWYAAQVDSGILHEQALTHQTPIIVGVPLAELAETRQLLKIMVIIDDSAMMASLQRVLVTADLPVSIKRSGQAYLEITSKLAIKSQGIAYLLNQTALSAVDAAAFGDGHNDLPMLRMVGMPIVMGNAPAEIQAIGRYVTKTNDEDGVAYGMTHFLI